MTINNVLFISFNVTCVIHYLWDILGAIWINVAYLEVKSTDVRQVINMRETMNSDTGGPEPGLPVLVLLK